MNCDHDLNAREVAVVADGYCPLCMEDELMRLTKALEQVREAKMPGQARAIAARALSAGESQK